MEGTKKISWVKRHKLWSLTLLYFGVGLLLGYFVKNPLALGEVMGLLYWPYLFICYNVCKERQGEKD